MPIKIPTALVAWQVAFRHHEKIHVAIGSHATAGIRSEKNDALRLRGFADLSRDPFYVRNINHDLAKSSSLIRRRPFVRTISSSFHDTTCPAMEQTLYSAWRSRPAEDRRLQAGLALCQAITAGDRRLQAGLALCQAITAVDRRLQAGLAHCQAITAGDRRLQAGLAHCPAITAGDRRLQAGVNGD
jgi:hypothetical protein